MWDERELERGDERFDTERDRRLQEQASNYPPPLKAAETPKVKRIVFAEDEEPPRPAVKPAKDFAAADFKKTAKEADIQLGIRQLLSLMGVPHSVTDASRTWGPDGGVRQGKVEPGWPDISCVIPFPSYFGRALFIETKAAKTGFQPGQKETHETLRAAGAIVVVPRSVGDFARAILNIADARRRAILLQVIDG